MQIYLLKLSINVILRCYCRHWHLNSLNGALSVTDMDDFPKTILNNPPAPNILPIAHSAQFTLYLFCCSFCWYQFLFTNVNSKLTLPNHALMLMCSKVYIISKISHLFLYLRVNCTYYFMHRNTGWWYSFMIHRFISPKYLALKLIKYKGLFLCYFSYLYSQLR